MPSGGKKQLTGGPVLQPNVKQASLGRERVGSAADQPSSREPVYFNEEADE
jgi:hypothetical protein